MVRETVGQRGGLGEGWVVSWTKRRVRGRLDG